MGSEMCIRDRQRTDCYLHAPRYVVRCKQKYVRIPFRPEFVGLRGAAVKYDQTNGACEAGCLSTFAVPTATRTATFVEPTVRGNALQDLLLKPMA